MLLANTSGGTSVKVISRPSAPVSAAAMSAWVMDSGPVSV